MEGISFKDFQEIAMEKNKKVHNLAIKSLNIKKQNNLNKIKELNSIAITLKELLHKGNNLYQSLKKVKVNNCKSFNVNILENANYGVYNIKIFNLAQNHTLSFIVNNTNNILGNESKFRKLKIIKINNNYPKEHILNIKKEETEIYNLSRIINNADLNINSEVKKISEEKLIFILQSRDFGKSGEMKVCVEGDSKLSELFFFDPKMNKGKNNKLNCNHMHQDVKALDAKILVNGNVYHRSTNIIDDIIPNVVINLLSRSKRYETLILNFDMHCFEHSLNDFLMNFNNILFRNYNLYKREYSKIYKNNIDHNDYSLNKHNLMYNRIITDIKNSLLNSFYLNTEKSTNLQSLGVEIDNSKNLKINKKILNYKIRNNLEEVKILFLGNKKNNGILDILFSSIKKYIDSDNGIIFKEIISLKNQNDNTLKQINRKNIILHQKIESEKIQYSRIEQNIKDMKSLSTQIQFMKYNFK